MGIEPARRMETTPRRRRSLRRRARRGGVVTQVVVALLCWAGFLLVIYATSPDNAAACAAFFLLLFGAVAFTVMPVLGVLTRRFSRSRLFQERSGMIAARQSVMLAAFLVLNAMLQMLRAWTGLVALLLFGMFAVIEVVALARR
jgi:hypothetical protein